MGFIALLVHAPVLERWARLPPYQRLGSKTIREKICENQSSVPKKSYQAEPSKPKTCSTQPTFGDDSFGDESFGDASIYPVSIYISHSVACVLACCADSPERAVFLLHFPVRVLEGNVPTGSCQVAGCVSQSC